MKDGPRSRLRAVLFVIVWAVVVAGLVHLDWHAGRPLEMRLSLGWDLHWLLGLGAGMGMAWMFVRRFGFGSAGPALLATGLLGFFGGQVIQPSLEALASGRSFGAVNPPLRWSIFAWFAVAWLTGAAVALAFRRARSEQAGTQPDQAS